MKYLKNRRLYKAFLYAFSGILVALKSERNFRIHILASCLAVAFGFYLDLSIFEWGFIVVAIGFVFITELINTAVERLGDEIVVGKFSKTVKAVKDISAGAVLVAAATAFIIGVLFLIIPFIHRVSG